MRLYKVEFQQIKERAKAETYSSSFAEKNLISPFLELSFDGAHKTELIMLQA